MLCLLCCWLLVFLCVIYGFIVLIVFVALEGLGFWLGVFVARYARQDDTSWSVTTMASKPTTGQSLLFGRCCQLCHPFCANTVSLSNSVKPTMLRGGSPKLKCILA